MKISVIGTGYVGLVTGACLAVINHEVICMDIDADKIRKLKEGIIPIYEPGLKKLIDNNPHLHFTTSIEEAVEHAEVIFIAVGTPADADGTPRLEHVYEAVNNIASHMDSYKLIVTKSTVPVGTTRNLKRTIDAILSARRCNVAYDIASNPEFLREGSAVKDFFHPERIVLGVDSQRAFELLSKVYDHSRYHSVPIVSTTPETAEMVKYASNTFLATKISFINEIAILCELVNADIEVISLAMGLDSRIGKAFLRAGPGFGGSCFPKDIRALLYTSKQMGYSLRLAQSVLDVNNRQAKRMVRKIRKLLGCLKGKTITMLGVSFKPETDDIRESPSVNIIKELIRSGARVRVYDPKALDNLNRIFTSNEVVYCGNVNSACTGSDCIVLATEWKEFSELDFQHLKSVVNTPVFLDLRNVYHPESVKQAGFVYEGVGRK